MASFYRIPRDVRVCVCGDDVVALVISSGKYFILRDVLSIACRLCIEKPILEGSISIELQSAVDRLLACGVICLRDELSDDYLHIDYAKLISGEGMKDYVWKIRSEYLGKRVRFRYLVQAYFCLIKMYYVMRRAGLAGIYRRIKKLSLKNIRGSVCLDDLVVGLNEASVWFPKRVRCLLWASALVELSIRNGVCCNLVIGVQNYPFLAHAWVEDKDGRVIGDSSELPKELSVIFREPFGENA